MRTLVSSIVISLVATACGESSTSGTGTSAASATPSASPKSTGSAAASASATASATASAAPSAPSAATSAAAVVPASPEPTLAEWDATKLDLKVVRGWDRTGCMARRVREWVRIACSTKDAGAPVRIDLVKGFPRAKYSVLESRGGSTMLVFPAMPGLDGEAEVIFEGAAYRFKASWPAGQPEPQAIGDFEDMPLPGEGGEAPSDAAGDDAAGDDAPGDAAADVPLPTEPEVEGAPPLYSWADAAEVSVKGSSAAGCETKVLGDWFRMVCRPTASGGKATSATAAAGFDPERGYLLVADGVLIVLTEYVTGTKTELELVWEKAAARFSLLWPEDADVAPQRKGEFVMK